MDVVKCDMLIAAFDRQVYYLVTDALIVSILFVKDGKIRRLNFLLTQFVRRCVCVCANIF
jgi:hypothetical protein